ncbi:hypothetical protein L914_00048 [Phytophthora nicotianae]|uniref:DUF659 domain-containing protein n=1 Tax=Phytophthora nicotianae TaxID=4792 RepID=W2P8T1_PHYNI|nr:hypothetical protein L914_00048 [Phytophthora nicotianae]
MGEKIPVDFGLILDDRRFGTEQYQSAFGCYDNPSGPRYHLIFMAPIMDEPGDHLTAKIHLTVIERFLPSLGRSIEKAKFLVLLIGCASHRLNLAVRNFLRPHKAALSEVRQLMRKVRTLNQAAKLRIEQRPN